jgi:hypothetical protein
VLVRAGSSIDDKTVLDHWLRWAQSNLRVDATRCLAAAEAATLYGMLGADQVSDGLAAARAGSELDSDYQASRGVWTSNDALTRLLAANWLPPTIPNPPIQLEPDERLVARADCGAWVFTRGKSEGEDVPESWRAFGESTICLTDQRILRQSRSKWNAVAYSDIKALALTDDDEGVVAVIGSRDLPFLYKMPRPHLWFLLMKHFVNAQAPVRPGEQLDTASGPLLDATALVQAPQEPVEPPTRKAPLPASQRHTSEEEAGASEPTTAVVSVPTAPSAATAQAAQTTELVAQTAMGEVQTETTQTNEVQTSNGATVTLSLDRDMWWDCAEWHDVAQSAPANADLSDDGFYWWDGTNWRLVPQS